MLQNFHVIFKSYGGKNLFHCEADYIVYLQMVRRACEKYQMRWLAYALMSNHIHLILRGEHSNLRDVRYNISSGYAAYYRRTYPGYGVPGKPVFRPHNTTKWLQANNDLQHALRYVHRNLIEKALEASLGDSFRSSYQAVLAARSPLDLENPFNQYDELQEIRDALDAEAVFRVFGKNHVEQLQNFIAFHQIPGNYEPEMPQKAPTEDLKKAESILQQYFSRRYTFSQKTYNGKNRQIFLKWLGSRGNVMKEEIVLRVAAETAFSGRQIAEFLQLGQTTVKKILRGNRK